MDALGLLGGTFDPIHMGHLRMAIEARERLGLAQIDLLPAADPPLKETPAVSAAHRLAMVERAVGSAPGLGVDGRELARNGVSYTVDTLREWRQARGDADSLVFIVGQDVLPNLHRWSRWESLLECCHMAVLVRPGASADLPAPVRDWLARHSAGAGAIHERAAGSVVQIEQPPLAVSSTAVREAIRMGRSVQYLLPAPVIEYIHTHELYGARATPHDTE